MEKKIKKSSINAKEKFDYEKLIYPREGFIPCTYKETLEEVIFEYEMEGLYKINALKKESKDRQYQCIINIVKVKELMLAYKIQLSEENLYYDENYLPYIGERDIYAKGEEANEEDFLLLYKSFIGGILGKRYSIRQLQESGIEVLKKERFFEEFYKAETIEDLVNILRERKDAYLKRQKKTTIRVSKTRSRFQVAAALLSSVLLIGSVVLLWEQLINVKPVHEMLIEANEAYIARDYVRCIDTLKEMEVEEMKVSTKYILATSYARGENLRREEIDEIISKLSLVSNERELEYWIHLGKMDMEKAEDLARALSDDKLLMYAYMKELNYLESNTSISGAEKSSRISTLESAIKSLGDKYAPVEEDVAQPEPVEIEETEQTNEEQQ